MKLRNKHIAYLALAAIPNSLLIFTIVFRDEMESAFGESGIRNFGFFVQIIASIVVVLGGWSMYQSYRSRSRFRFWTIATILAAIPFIYFFIF